jgi:pimeloyl-ACP methyl ester carboxylesterase
MSNILLVHGAWHGPWCWDDFAQRLRQQGHDVRAVRLRGHDQRPGRIWHRVRHYVEDVKRAAGQFDHPPVLVGHSMGGFVVQRYLERNQAAAAVLMASVPTGGALPATARLAAHHPIAFMKVNLLWSLRPFIATPGLVRELFFAPDTPREVVDRCRVRLQDESYPAFVDLLLGLRRRRTSEVPVLVLGAELDGFFTLGETRRTARAYRTEAEIFPGIGHDMMLDDGWPGVADRVDGWVRETLA